MSNYLRVLVSVLSVVMVAGCCPDEPRWFVNLHCNHGLVTVECYSQSNCQTLLSAVARLGTACPTGSVGRVDTCEEDNQ